MKPLFNIKLYRSFMYKMIHIIISGLSLFVVIFCTLYILLNLINGITFYEIFFEKYTENVLWRDSAVVAAMVDLVKFIFGIIFYIFVLTFSLFSLTNNKIVVYNEYIKIRYAPRYLNRYVNMKNIIDIIPLQSEDYSLAQRIMNFNFSKNYLYKIITKYNDYNETIVISCMKKSDLEKLITIIRMQGDISSVSDNPNN